MTCLGVRLIVKAIKNERVNEHREENLGFKRFWRMAAVTSIYTLLTGIAFGFLETNLMVILIMIVCLTIAVVIMGTYTGYHFGFEHKRKAYVGGAILLWIAGFDVVSVSYTHLDVYKRQGIHGLPGKLQDGKTLLQSQAQRRKPGGKASDIREPPRAYHRDVYKRQGLQRD